MIRSKIAHRVANRWSGQVGMKTAGDSISNKLSRSIAEILANYMKSGDEWIVTIDGEDYYPTLGPDGLIDLLDDPQGKSLGKFRIIVEDA